MTKRDYHGVIIECVQGDIARQPDMQAIVNAANAQLQIGGGVAGAIHRAAGPGLARECRALAPIQPGTAVISSAHDLPNEHVIHCLGPVYGSDEPADQLLASCYRQALQLAEQHGIASVAFPAISTGAFGYPLEPATRIAIGTCVDMLDSLSALRHIRHVLFSDSDLEVYAQVLDELLSA